MQRILMLMSNDTIDNDAPDKNPSKKKKQMVEEK